MPGAVRRLDDVERPDAADTNAEDVAASVVDAGSGALGG
jgi:hypothetical protein